MYAFIILSYDEQLICTHLLAYEDDIKTEYHPSSKRSTTIHRFHEYGLEEERLREPTVDFEEIPWAPFQTRRDFNAAALAVDAMLNNTQIDALISLIGNASDERGGGVLTIHNHKELNEIWEDAEYLFPKVGHQS